MDLVEQSGCSPTFTSSDDEELVKKKNAKRKSSEAAVLVEVKKRKLSPVATPLSKIKLAAESSTERKRRYNTRLYARLLLDNTINSSGDIKEMSQIPKTPVTASKENKPSMLSRRPMARTLVSALSDASEMSDVSDGHGGPSTTVPVQRLKRSSSVYVPPSKATNLKKKKPTYNELLGSFMNIKRERDKFKKDCHKMKVDIDNHKHETENVQHEIVLLNEIIINKKAEMQKLQSELTELSRQHKDLKEETEKKIAKYKSDSETLQNTLAAMHKDQRHLRNTIQDLKGNIRVYCRIRPPLESEQTKTRFNLNVLDACSIELKKYEVEKVKLLNSDKKGKSQHRFTFDGIFTSHSSQDDVFAEVSPMVQSALDGYNVCIFAYGQTGSGKTYTMEGGYGTEEQGIIPRAFNMIFTCMDDLKRMGWELTIKVSFLEIYNEIIYDLLNSSKDQVSHEIKMSNPTGTELYVSNLKEEEVKNSREIMRLMRFAQRNRQTAATSNNERSSRSHSVAQIKISAINKKRVEKYTSNLNLVDLAGSERGKTSERMDETKHINRSLSELSKVILGLQTNQSHIPYRNSKLTHLLTPSLGGNSKTLMLVNINQFDEYFNETLNSLRFARQVNNCRVVKAKKNIM